MLTYAGMRVFVSLSSVETIKRTWRERLFTRPWRPLVATGTKIREAAVPPDACYRIGNDLHCGERFYQRLEAATKEQSNGI